MARQLEFSSLAGSSGARAVPRRLAGATLRGGQRAVGLLLRWAPVWLPAVLLAQVALFGLLPELAERARLDRVEAELVRREEALRADAQAVERRRRMLADDVYRERVRKSLARTGRPPRTDEGAGGGPRDR